jgi:hypothetical protein
MVSRIKPLVILTPITTPFTGTGLGRHLDQHKTGSRMILGGNLLREPDFGQVRKYRLEAIRVTSNEARATTTVYSRRLRYREATGRSYVLCRETGKACAVEARGRHSKPTTKVRG